MSTACHEIWESQPLYIYGLNFYSTNEPVMMIVLVAEKL